jgi:hypothetical protein
VMMCSTVNWYQHFRGTWLKLQGRSNQTSHISHLCRVTNKDR